jgi:hypothetical protein
MVRLTYDQRREAHKEWIRRLEAQGGAAYMLYDKCRELIRTAEDWLRSLEGNQGSDALPDQLYKSGLLKALSESVPILVRRVLAAPPQSKPDDPREPLPTTPLDDKDRL